MLEITQTQNGKIRVENFMDEISQIGVDMQRELEFTIGSKIKRVTRESVEPESWTHPELIEGGDVYQNVQPKMERPLAELFALVESRKEISVSCLRLAEFLKRQLENQCIKRLIQKIFQTRYSRVWMERFLIIFLDVKTSDWQTLDYALQFRHLKRLFLRVEKQISLNQVETNLANELIQNLSLTKYWDFEPFCAQASKTAAIMRMRSIPVSGDLGLLIYLLRCEVICMEQRRQWIFDGLISGDPEMVIKQTPHLKLLEERISKTQELAERLGNFGSLHDEPMSLSAAMGPVLFTQLKAALAGVCELKPLLAILEIQEQKRVPTRDLIALSTLTRWNLEGQGLKTNPIEWIRMALDCYNKGHFSLDITNGLPAVDILISEVTVEKSGTSVFGNFGENPYMSWIARDGLSRPFRSSNPDRNPPDLRSLVLANIHRDQIILKLLEQPTVYLYPGVVETIVAHTASISVLTTVAKRPELHTGEANGRVPVALLRSLVELPLQIIAKLIDPCFISFTDIKALYRMREKLREGVVEELHQFLVRAYAI